MTNFVYTNKWKVSGFHLFNSFILFFILFLQFQNLLGISISDNNHQLSHIVFLIDKVIFIFFFFAFIYIRSLDFILNDIGLVRRGRISLLRNELILFAFLVIFLLWCFISAMINHNDIMVSLNGTFVYVNYFLVFFIFSSLTYTESVIKRSYRFLLNVALFLCVVSIGQEVLAFIYPASVDWWPNTTAGEYRWRYGLFRAPSLLRHANSIGTFALFFWTVELAILQQKNFRNNKLNLVILGLAILFSMSRAALGGALIALFFLSRPLRKLSLISLPFIIVVMVFLASFPDIVNKDLSDKFFRHDEYRSFAQEMSLDVWRDHPFSGTGPGMYGGHVSLKYNSPIYQQYEFSGIYFEYLKEVGSIEQQWMQMLAELGMIGVFLFILVLSSPIIILFRLSKARNSQFIETLIAAFMVMPVQMCFYAFGYNIPNEWMVPYFVFLGMLVGMQRRNNTIYSTAKTSSDMQLDILSVV